MSDIEILKQSIINTAKTVSSQLGISGFNPLISFGLTNLLNKPKYAIFLEAMTDAEGNVDINKLSVALNDALAAKGGKVTMAGVSFDSEDIQKLKEEFKKLKHE